MKYIVKGGKKYFVNTKGEEILDAEGNPTEVPASVEAEATEFVAPAAGEGEDEAVEELKSFINSNVKDAVAALDIKGTFNKTIAKELSSIVESSKSVVKDSLDIEATMKAVGDVKTSAGKSHEFEVKTLSELNSLTNTSGNIIVEDRQAGIERAPVRSTFMLDLANVSATNKNRVSWVEVTGESGAPATTAELAAMPAKDYTFTSFGADVLKIGVTTKHSIEILEDAPELVTAVRSMLAEDLALKLDEKIYNGAGTAGEFKGVRTYATAFAAGSLVIPTPNNLDVLRAAISQVHVAGKGKYQVTDIVMNPADVTALDLAKGSDGHYIMPPFSTSDRTTVKGVRITENTLVTAGDFLVGDFRKLQVRMARGASVQTSTENVDDFEKDLISIRATVRAAIYVKTNDTGAFVKGTFATAITDLTS